MSAAQAAVLRNGIHSSKQAESLHGCCGAHVLGEGIYLVMILGWLVCWQGVVAASRMPGRRHLPGRFRLAVMNPVQLVQLMGMADGRSCDGTAPGQRKRTCSLRCRSLLSWWALRGSNPRPKDY